MLKIERRPKRVGSMKIIAIIEEPPLPNASQVKETGKHIPARRKFVS